MKLLFAFYYTNIVQDYEQWAQQEGSSAYGYMDYFIESLVNLTHKTEEVILLNSCSDEAYDTVLTPGLRAIGAGFNPYHETSRLIKCISEINPTHLIVQFPFPPIFRWAIRRQIPTAICMADSFYSPGLKSRIKNFLLARQLNHQQINWIANHGLNSCLDLQRIGVNPDKIIPWDFPHEWDTTIPSKQLRQDANHYTLIFVGSVSEAKGVGDTIRGMKHLADQNLKVKLKIAGKGDIDAIRAEAKSVGLEDAVEFMGLVPNNQIVALMHQADLVMIPSRNYYPEGFPLTIFEALKSRTPIIASDHPMFRGFLEHRKSAMVFSSGHAEGLANSIRELISHPDLYAGLSANAEQVWQTLQLPVKRHAFFNACVDVWLDKDVSAQKWLYQHRLSSGQYDLTTGRSK